LLDDLGDRRGYSHLKEEALNRLSGGIVLEEALDLSFDRLLMMMMMMIRYVLSVNFTRFSNIHAEFSFLRRVSAHDRAIFRECSFTEVSFHPVVS
jgi:hypothetical protein